MPLIMKLGYMIGDKARADVFQFSRACDSWNWSTKEQTNSFSAKKQVVRDGGRIALVFSLTADIATTRITEVYDADILYFIRAARFGVIVSKVPQIWPHSGASTSPLVMKSKIHIRKSRR